MEDPDTAREAPSAEAEAAAVDVFYDPSRPMDERIAAYVAMRAADLEPIELTPESRVAIVRYIRQLDTGATIMKEAASPLLNSTAALAAVAVKDDEQVRAAEAAQRAIYRPLAAPRVRSFRARQGRTTRPRARQGRSTRRATARAGPDDDGEPEPPRGRSHPDLTCGGAS